MPAEPSYRAFEFVRPAEGLQFLDIGANRGQTIASFRLYDQSTPVVAFEPNSLLAARLNRTYSQDAVVTVHQFGLGADPGYFELWIPYYREFVFDGLASFSREQAENWLNSDRIYGFDKSRLRLERVLCEVRRWDDMPTRPGLVKIDVQGFESNVILGGLQTIEKYRPIFLIENDKSNSHESLLLPMDYRRAAFEDNRIVMDKTGFGSTFYVPSEKLDQIGEAWGDRFRL